MIAPTEADIGRTVIYQGGHPDDTDEGVITSFNEHYVFVRYRKQHPSAPGRATSPDDLRWAHAGPTEPEPNRSVDLGGVG